MTSKTTGTEGDQLSVSTEQGVVPQMRTDSDAPAAEEELLGTEELALPLPLLRRRSGVYTRRRRIPIFEKFPFSPLQAGVEAEEDADLASTDDGGLNGAGSPLLTPIPLPTIPSPLRYRYGSEELRVDVDGRTPTMTVSGVIPGGLFVRRLTWIARVKRTATGTYKGKISYRDGTSSLLPQTQVEVALSPTLPIAPLIAIATFSGGTAPTVTRQYGFAHSNFREANFEFDRVSDVPAAAAVTDYDTASHPNRPASLPAEMLTIESAYGNMGIKVTRSGDNIVPISAAGANTLWSDVEMHDAMQVNWSKFANVPQWALWVLFARQHETGPSLGGIMFDDIGTAQRQGTAIFSESFVANAPAGDPAPVAWVRRMRFWTAMHEIGHSLNLAHSWQKSLGTGWVPLADEVEARSYMNYPYRVAAAPGMTPEQRFFSTFEFRFSEKELLFMRHAPERFVQQGNALWFDHHAFEETRATTVTPLELVARLHREPRFEFLEPVTIELKLKNVSESPMIVDERILEGDQISLVITKKGGDPRALRPYARRCFAPEDRALMPGESLYASLFVSSDVYGSVIDEPGEYAVYALLDLDEVDVLAAPLTLRVMPPASRDEERIAPDVFTDGVGRILAFGGSRVLGGANDTLAEAAERFPDRRIAVHAQAALGAVAAKPGKVLERSGSGEKEITVQEADVPEALDKLGSAYADLDAAADTFGHIDVTQQVMQYAETVKESGDAEAAGDIANSLADTLDARGVKSSVVEATREKAAELGG
jgi:hypothetical protein